MHEESVYTKKSSTLSAKESLEMGILKWDNKIYQKPHQIIQFLPKRIKTLCNHAKDLDFS